MKTIDEIRRENLATLVTDAGGVGALAKRANKSDSQISQWLNASVNSGTGKPRGMRSSSCRELELACEKPTGWMEIDHERDMAKPIKSATDQNSSRLDVPIISFRKASLVKEINVPYPIDPLTDYLVVDDDHSDFSFAVELEDDSMLPDFRPGDHAVFDPELTPLPGDYVLVNDSRGECTFRKYRRRGEDRSGKFIFEVAPSNPDFSTLRSDETDLKIIAVMTEHRRKIKRR